MFLKNLTLQEASEIAAQKNKELKIMEFLWCITCKKIQTSIDGFSLLKHKYV